MIDIAFRHLPDRISVSKFRMLSNLHIEIEIRGHKTNGGRGQICYRSILEPEYILTCERFGRDPEVDLAKFTIL